MVTAKRLCVFMSAALFGAFAGPTADAQLAFESRFEVRPVVGAYLPTGKHRDMLDDAITVGVQGAYAITGYLSIVGTFSVTPSSDTRLTLDDDLDVFSYDLGAELQKSFTISGSGTTVSPFIGVGAGGRTYDYRDLAMHAESDVAAYAALGAHLRLHSVGVRIEAREYASSFRGLTGEMSSHETRTDIAILSALSFYF